MAENGAPNEAGLAIAVIGIGEAAVWGAAFGGVPGIAAGAAVGL